MLALVSVAFAVSGLWWWKSRATVWNSDYVLGLGTREQLGIERRHMNDLVIELQAARSDLNRKNKRIRLALIFVVASWTWELATITFDLIVELIGGCW